MTKNDKNESSLLLNKLAIENKQLKKDNQILSNELAYFKEYSADCEEDINILKARCRQLAIENQNLISENKDLKFAKKCFHQDEMLNIMNAEEECENEAVSAMASFLGDD